MNPENTESAGAANVIMDPSLKLLWTGKYEFNRSVLGLNEKTALEWANRTIRAIRQTELEFATTLPAPGSSHIPTS
jgi:hypothetical protein